jgi:hypothetical protein
MGRFVRNGAIPRAKHTDFRDWLPHVRIALRQPALAFAEIA